MRSKLTSVFFIWNNYGVPGSLVGRFSRSRACPFTAFHRPPTLGGGEVSCRFLECDVVRFVKGQVRSNQGVYPSGAVTAMAGESC